MPYVIDTSLPLDEDCGFRVLWMSKTSRQLAYKKVFVKLLSSHANICDIQKKSNNIKVFYKFRGCNSNENRYVDETLPGRYGNLGHRPPKENFQKMSTTSACI